MKVRISLPKNPYKTQQPRPPLKQLASAPDRLLDVVHVSSELAGSRVGNHPLLTLANAGIAASSLYMGAKELGESGFEHKAEATMLLAMSAASGLSVVSDLGAPGLEGLIRPLEVVHGAADVALGLHGFKEAREHKDHALMAVSGLEVGVGAAIVASALTSNHALGQALTLGAFTGMVIKQAIIQTH